MNDMSQQATHYRDLGEIIVRMENFARLHIITALLFRGAKWKGLKDVNVSRGDVPTSQLFLHRKP
jgi:hypothetical protein